MTTAPPPPEDPLEAVARDLRQRVGEELRRDAEEAEQLAAIAAARRRTVRDAFVHLRDAGRPVAVRVGGRDLVGTVVAVGDDYAVIEGPAGRWELPLDQPLAWRATGDQPRSIPPPERLGARSWHARLLELELAGAEVVVDAGDLGEWRGRLVAAAVDHLVLRQDDGAAVSVARPAVAVIRPTGG